ncbi:MAG TPA: integral HD domain-containing protein [Bdellovibrionales bacterium]|nr:integral HD domain-containing protein [Bdellovibrionales bacterium]
MVWPANEIPDWAQAVAKTLLRALKERDPYTYGHCRRVARNAKLLAEAAGLNEFEQSVVEYASLFHDLGKIGVPDTVLLKPGRLTEDEEAVMRLHPVKSAEMMNSLIHIPFFRATLPGIRHHHERIDGTGYPDGLKGTEIPFVSRILLVADTFDAMTTTRPYRKGLAHEIAYKELERYSNLQFDAALVEMFVKAHPGWPVLSEEETGELFVSVPLKKAA